MINIKRRILSLAIVLMLVFTMAGAACITAYAGGPAEIIYSEHDRWLWPGDSATVGIAFDSGVSAVQLLKWDPEYDSWYICANCKYQDAEKTMWYCDIEPLAGNKTGVERYCFDINYGELTSPEFAINWTYEQGIDRVYGNDRYETSLKAAEIKRGWTSSSKYENVVIACGTNFADALGGTYLAYKYNAPILLVNTKPDIIQKVAGNVATYLKPSGKVFILGGTGAVPEDMEAALTAGGIDILRIKRFSGSDRYDTNLQILKYCSVAGGDLLICSGTNFPDALSASATGRPILLVKDKLQEEQVALFNAMVPQMTYIIGGEGAVSKAVEQGVKDFGLEYLRLAGNDRYETSLAVAIEFFSDRQRMYCTMAYGHNFPDGLSGGPLSLQYNAPLILVRNGMKQEAIDNAAAYIKYNARSRHAVILGGPTLISDQLAKDIMDIHPMG